MNKTIQKLDLESESALNYALNKSIQSIKSGNFELNFGVEYILTTTISIGISSSEYLIISNDWADTTEEALDYYFLKTRIENKPADIKRKREPLLKNILINCPNFSSLQLGATSKLKEITIYEKIEKGEIEKVEYDSAIFFRRVDDLCFLIKNDDSIAGYLKLVTNEKQIAEELKELNQRLKITEK